MFFDFASVLVVIILGYEYFYFCVNVHNNRAKYNITPA